MKYKFRFIFILFLFSVKISAQVHGSSLEKSLQRAGSNRVSLEKVLKHYYTDKEKYKAACFLIENMQWHSQAGKVESYDPQIDAFRKRGDSLYYSFSKGKTDEQVNTVSFLDSLAKIDTPYRGKVEKYPFKEPEVTGMDMPDIEYISGDFLIKHIDNAFKIRNESLYARKLSFRDFCSYILPYRVIGDYPLVYSGDNYAEVYDKYVQAAKTKNVTQAIDRYNRTASRLRYFMGKYPFETNTGFNELFFRGFHDCVDIANYGASALRACGIPAVVEYNVAYKLWSGRHYHVSTPDSLGRWCTYSPESGLPKYRDTGFREALNIFRIHFDKQNNNPYTLKNTNEEIPENLSGPCIEDVTKNIMPAFEITFPFLPVTKNNLAYLVSFQSRSGLVPVTWGAIDKAKKTVTFKNVVPDNLYFPMYFSDGKLTSFQEPFWISTDSLAKVGYNIKLLKTTQGQIISAELLCKFPRKPGMLKAAENLKGVFVIASDSANFSKADTLYKIKETPDENWQDMNLNNKKAYKFYRIRSRKEYPHLHIAEIEFLTDKSYGYTNTMKATDLPVLSSKQTINKDVDIVRLLDEPLEQCKWKAEYDGNIQTAPDRWPDVTLKLKEPQVVTKIRFIPKSADNGIKQGDFYRLFMWNDTEWELIKSVKAEHNYIVAEKMEVGKLYWLNNATRGSEELPFYIDKNGQQQFLHYDLLKQFRQ